MNWAKAYCWLSVVIDVSMDDVQYNLDSTMDDITNCILKGHKYNIICKCTRYN